MARKTLAVCAPLWWLSFADADKPPGQAFLGVAIVHTDTDSLIAAVRKAHELGCNPGGEVMGYLIEATDSVPASSIGRLLSREEAESLPCVEPRRSVVGEKSSRRHSDTRVYPSRRRSVRPNHQ
jgi:hypothetical protein